MIKPNRLKISFKNFGKKSFEFNKKKLKVNLPLKRTIIRPKTSQQAPKREPRLSQREIKVSQDIGSMRNMNLYVQKIKVIRNF